MENIDKFLILVIWVAFELDIAKKRPII